jgi:hypothetical protein
VAPYQFESPDSEFKSLILGTNFDVSDLAKSAGRLGPLHHSKKKYMPLQMALLKDAVKDVQIEF